MVDFVASAASGSGVLSIPTSIPLKISSTISVFTSVKSEALTPV